MKKKNTSSDNNTVDVREMKALHVALICLIIFVVFNYSVAPLRPLIRQDNNHTPKAKANASSNSLRISPRGKPGLTILGDPIEDPTPHHH